MPFKSLVNRSRLMHTAGSEGARRTRRVRTTRADPVAARHPDLVQRRFAAAAPNQLWVTDLTFVPTWVGVAYVCFEQAFYAAHRTDQIAVGNPQRGPPPDPGRLKGTG